MKEDEGEEDEWEEDEGEKDTTTTIDMLRRLIL